MDKILCTTADPRVYRIDYLATLKLKYLVRRYVLLCTLVQVNMLHCTELRYFPPGRTVLHDLALYYYI